MLEVIAMAGFATVQDSGRAGYRAQGVPPSGAVDCRSLSLANALAGNDSGAAAIEWALAGGCVRFGITTTAAVTGADVELSLNGETIPSGVARQFEAGDELRIHRFVRGSHAYLAVRGGIDVPVVLGSRSTYLSGAFGGLGGQRLRVGDKLPVGPTKRTGAIALGGTHESVALRSEITVRVVAASQHSLDAAYVDEFWRTSFTLSPRSNRIGYRLERDCSEVVSHGSSISAPACVGAIQVPSTREAIVLMPDAPTVGGYPIVGVVASVDLPLLAQLTPGSTARFERIPVSDAQRLLRDRFSS